MTIKHVCALFVALGSAVAWAEDLTVPAGESVTISTNCTYGTITVHGTLTVTSGAKVTYTTVELGPDEGDDALISLVGDGTCLGTKAVNSNDTRIYIGRNGGKGKITSDASTGTALKVQQLFVCKNAAVPASGYFDFLQLNKGAISFKNIFNNAAFVARLTTAGGVIGTDQAWSAVLVNAGKVRIESVNGANIKFGTTWAPLTIVSSSAELTLDANGKDVVFEFTSGDRISSYTKTWNSSLHFEDVRDVRVSNATVMSLANPDVIPYGEGFGILKVESWKGYVTIGTLTQHLNGLVDTLTANDFSSKGYYSVGGSDGAKLVFGAGDVDGVYRAWIAKSILVEKVGTGTLSVTNAASGMGSLLVSEGKVAVNKDLSLDSLAVADGAEIELNGVVLAPATGFASLGGTVTLKNGAKLSCSALDYCGKTVSGLMIDVTRSSLVVSNATLAASGVIDLSGYMAQVPHPTEIPLEFENCEGVSNLSGWKLAFDGAVFEGFAFTYDGERKCLRLSGSFVTYDASGNIDMEGDVPSGNIYAEVKSGVTVTNTTAITGERSVNVIGGGKVVFAADSTFSGGLTLSSGTVKPLVGGAFGTGTVNLSGNGSSVCCIEFGPFAAATEFANDIVFVSSSATYPAFRFHTAAAKCTIKGTVSGTGKLYMADDGTSNQAVNLVSFDGNVSVGESINYAPDNAVYFNAKVTTPLLYTNGGWPQMGEFDFTVSSNEIDRIDFSYTRIYCRAADALPGTSVYYNSHNTEGTYRGGFCCFGNSQTLVSVDSPAASSARFLEYREAIGKPEKIVFTGDDAGTHASASLHLGSYNTNKSNADTLTIEVNARNPAFVQEFAGTDNATKGELIARNGTLRFSGSTICTNMTGASVHSGGVLSFGTTNDGVFNADVFDVDLFGTGRLAIDEGTEVTVHMLRIDGAKVSARSYTGLGSTADPSVKRVSWISGSGVLTTQTGSIGLMLLIR